MLNKAKSSRSCVCLEPSNRPKGRNGGKSGQKAETEVSQGKRQKKD